MDILDGVVGLDGLPEEDIAVVDGDSGSEGVAVGVATEAQSAVLADLDLDAVDGVRPPSRAAPAPPEAPSLARRKSSEAGGDLPAEEMLAEIEMLYQQLAAVRQQQAELTRGGGPQRAPRVIILTTRLPFSLVRDGTAASGWTSEATESVPPNHAVNHFRAMHKEGRCLWVGMTGAVVAPGAEQATLKSQLRAHNYAPVFTSASRAELHYSGYCKSVLYPTFHSVPLSTDFHINTHDVEEPQDSVAAMWKAYRVVNQLFADAVQEVYQEGDVVWVFGYQLMLVPGLVRRMVPAAAVGFFLQSPFPTSEFYRQLPTRKELLKGVLQADVVGFQIYEYAQHFRNCCTQVMGLETTPVGVEHKGWFCSISVFPMGIQPELYADCIKTEDTQKRIAALRAQNKDKIVIIGVDKLDDANGLSLKLNTFHRLLKRHPDLRERVVLLQVTARPIMVTGVRERMITALQKHVGMQVVQINSTMGRVGRTTPAKHVPTPDKFAQLCAMYVHTVVKCVRCLTWHVTPNRYAIADIALVPFEYTVCREAVGRPACVVLSEFTATASLLKGPVLVNPYDSDQTLDTLVDTIKTVRSDPWPTHRQMLKYITSHSTNTWARSFLRQLGIASQRARVTQAGVPRPLEERELMVAFQDHSSRRVVIVDVEDVLLVWPSIKHLATVAKGSVKLPASIETLCADPRTIVVLVSTHSCRVLEAVADNVNCVLVAEDGCFVRWSSGTEWECLVPDQGTALAQLVPVCTYFEERTPGSALEVKAQSIAFHYRNCAKAQLCQVNDLHATLESLTRHLPLSVLRGHQCIDIRAEGGTKGAAVLHTLGRLATESHPSEVADDSGDGRAPGSLAAPATSVDFIFVAVRGVHGKHHDEGLYESIGDACGSWGRVLPSLASSELFRSGQGMPSSKSATELSKLAAEASRPLLASRSPGAHRGGGAGLGAGAGAGSGAATAVARDSGIHGAATFGGAEARSGRSGSSSDASADSLGGGGDVSRGGRSSSGDVHTLSPKSSPSSGRHDAVKPPEVPDRTARLFMCRVGKAHTRAGYFVESLEGYLGVLSILAAVSGDEAMGCEPGSSGWRSPGSHGSVGRFSLGVASRGSVGSAAREHAMSLSSGSCGRASPEDSLWATAVP